MGIKDLYKGMKYKDDSLTKRIDSFLATNKEENDRAVDVNSPSQVFKCKRALFYGRTEAESDGFIDPRLQRIFDNGTGMHERIQGYLLKEGTLLMDECPCIDEEMNIQGHTDGLLKMSDHEYSILELKSINSMGFSKLKEAKEEHQAQAMIYMYCTECRRQEIEDLTDEEFEEWLEEREKFYEKRYAHLQGGDKYTKEEKIANSVRTNLELDRFLRDIKYPINKIYFLYENKDTQDLKEFVVEYDDDLMSFILDFYEDVNYYVENNIVPPREGTSKSCQVCRWCSYKGECYVV